jgi:hypothetical protein
MIRPTSLQVIGKYIFISGVKFIYRLSQWPRGLRHEMSSPAQTLGRGFKCNSRRGCLFAFLLRLCCPV